MNGAAVHLLDGNVVVALLVTDHVHHRAATRWFLQAGQVATSPTGQGTVLRYLVRTGVPAQNAQASLRSLTTHERHEQWLDDVPYTEVDLSGVHGHRQVTDAYLAQLARTHGGRLATFDRGLAAAAPDVTVLLPA